MSCNEWKEYALKDVIEFNPRETIKKGTLSKKVPMDKLDTFTRKISGYEETEFTSGTKFRNGDTLLARITPCLENGKTARVDILEDNEIGFGSTEFIVMREKEGKTINDFIYYLSISPEFRNIAIKSMTGSSGRQRVQKDVLENVEIKLPPLEEQEKIANILSSLDDKIELNNEMNKTLEEMAQSIFKRWFVDFEFLNEDGKPYKSSGGELIDSELGMIPKGWEVGTLNDVAEFQNGYAFKSKELLDNNVNDCYHVFKMGHIKKGGGLNKLGTKSYIEKSKCENIQKYVIKKGDLLMCMTDMKSNVALLGHTALMDEDDKYILNQRVGLLRCINKEKMNYPYLYILTNYSDFIENLRSRANSGVQVNLSTKEIKETKILIPQFNIHKLFDSIAINICEKQFILSKENEKLSDLRDTLLPKLMNGEISLSK